jgi:hypothetical protein
MPARFGSALVVTGALVLNELEQLVLVNEIEVMWMVELPVEVNAAVVKVPPLPVVATTIEAVVEATVLAPLTL